MKTLFAQLILITVVLFSCKTQETEQKTATIEKYTIEQFYKNENIGGGSFSPDEKALLISSNRTGIFNVYTLPLEGGEPVRLTESTVESFFGVSYFPDDNWFIYTADQGGNENNHIYMSDGTGTVKDLTPFEGSKNMFMGWTKDEKSMFYASNKRDPRFYDVYELSVEEVNKEVPVASVVYENNEGLNVSAISNNKRYLALSKAITTSNNELYLYDRESGEQTHISPHEGDATYSAQFFSQDDSKLFFVTNEGSEFNYLVSYDVETGEKTKEFETEWDVAYAYESWTGKYRVVGVNEDAKTRIYIFDEKGGNVQLPEINGNVNSVNIAKSENLASLTVGSSTSPSDVYIYDFTTKELKKLTNSLNPEINEEHLVEAEVIRYKSFDGLEIPAIYYQPKEASADNKVPAMVWVHGGPGGQSRVGYFSLIQYLVNHGYAVLAVNNRGSSGYGKTFYQMDDQKHGDVDLKDCIEAKKFLIGTGVIDEEKIGIMGGSYGGYMTMAAMTFAPEEFAVGVNIFGVTNWLRTLKSIPPHWESQRKALYQELGDPFTEDSVRLHAISPVFHAQNVTKPLMVLQGANDVRVLQVESDDIVEAVKANGVPVEYIIFDDEGHGFRKKENEIEGYGKIKVFLDKYLKKEETAEPVAVK